MKTTKICLLLISLSLIFACGKEKISINEEEPKEIKIGVILSLSGDLAPIGQMVQKGIELAVEEINLIGGVDNSKLKLIFFDDKSETAESSKGAEMFFREGDIPVIIGGVSNDSTISIISVTSKIRMPVISPVASGIGISKVSPYVFRNGLTDVSQAKAMAEHAFTVMKLRTFAVIYSNDEQGVNLNRIFSQRIQEIGGKIIANESYDSPASDFSVLLSKLKVIEPQAIYFTGKINDILLITRQSVSQGLNVSFLGTDNWREDELITLGGEYVEGAVYTASFNKYSSDKLVVNFVQRFRDKFRTEPNSWSAQGYDAARLVVQAMFSGGKDKQGIKDGLLKIKNFPGVTGKISFDSTGEVERDIIILGINNGKVLQLQ